MTDSSVIRPDALACYQAIARPELASKVWLVTEDRSITFGELATRIRSVGGYLAGEGIGPGQRVVLSSRNDADAAVLLIALICHGVTAINLDPDTAPERAISLISKADPGLLIVDMEITRRWQLDNTQWRLTSLLPAVSGNLLGKMFGKQAPAGGLDGILAGIAPQAPVLQIPPDTLAYILFTSGTTSQPKGVSISHRALFAHLATLQRRLQYDASSRILNTLMLSHADGMIQGPVLGFYNQCTVLRPLRFEVTRIEPLLDAIYQLRISHMVAVPTMLALLLRLGGGQRDAFLGGDFRLLISCGAQLDKTLWQDFCALFKTPLVNIYGLTETVVGGVFSGPDAHSGVPGSIGMPEDCELRLLDAAGEPVAEGNSGELWMRGELLMSGYFAEPVLTAEVLQDGWLCTGDIARRDDQGRYWVMGRSKNIIIRGGYNIHPEEVTEVLEHHPAVREAVVFGVPDPVWGEVVAALVVADGDIGQPELLGHCATQLEVRKVPSHLQVVAALPRGRSGKVLLEKARELLDLNAQVHGEVAENVEQRLLAVAARAFKMPAGQLALHMSPDDVAGWDSLAHLELVVAVEKEFGISISPREIMALDRLNKILPLIART